MRYLIPPMLALAGLGGCTEAMMQGPTGAADPVAAPATVAPVLAPPPPAPPVTATTAAQFDTTTAEDRTAALAAPAPAAEVRLGTTLATLGSPADPGIWIETPLVDAIVMGRVEVVATGKAITLELRPSGGAEGSGSQISLPAMRLLELPLTAIEELAVYSGGSEA